MRLGCLGLLTASFSMGAGSCSSGGDNNTVPTPDENEGGSGPSGKGGKGMTGSGGKGGSEDPGMGGKGMSTGMGGTETGAGGVTSGMGGAAGAEPGMGGAAGAEPGMGGASGMGGAMTDGWMGYKGIEDLSQVKKTPGCGMPTMQASGQWVGFTTAVPIPAGHDGPGGDGMRRYFVKLPPNYDNTKPYKVVIGGSSCVPQQTNPAPIDFANATNGSGGVIQITPIVEPGVMAEGSYVCYDDKDTNSIEYPFIEKFLKEVGDKFCYDQHKVFVQGHSSGGWYSNMMGCVYGSTLLRGMSSNGGGIARGGPPITPPCKETPIPGMWILPTGDTEGRPDTGDALDRALRLNKCEGGGMAGAYMKAPTDPYTAGGAVNCKKYRCPDAFPVVFCQPPGGHGNVSWHAAAAWALFNGMP
jgi:poly(3-hydroxybutyrate) depolymerase